MDDFDAMSDALDALGDTGVQVVMDLLEEIDKRLSLQEHMLHELMKAIRSLQGSAAPIPVGGRPYDRISRDDINWEQSRVAGGIDKDAIYKQLLGWFDETSKERPMLSLHTA